MNAPSKPHQKRILVVDDDVDVTHVIRLILLETGHYDVRVVNHAQLAAKAVQQFRPDLVLLDVMMPDCDGGTVAAEIRACPETADTRIVFLTAAVTGEEARKGPIGGETYLEKPVCRERLIAAVNSHLGRAA